MMTSSLLMPASVAWRTLGAPRRGAGRLLVAPQVPGYRVLREIGTGRRSSAWLAVDTGTAARWSEVQPPRLDAASRMGDRRALHGTRAAGA